MKEKIIGVIVIVLLAIFMINCFSCGSCGGGKDGGRCQVCGTHTNWTYKAGGYVCYSCYKKVKDFYDWLE